MDSAIQIDQLVHQYKQKNSPAISLSHWQVAKGERIFLHGDSGSGKSTLLNLLSGVLKPTSGSIKLLGEDVTAMSNSQRDGFRANHIGVVFQTLNLIPYLSVLENIKLAAYFANNKADVIEHAKSLISQLQLTAEVLNKPVSELSIGQQQRVAIVRALVNKPEILLVDEPTSALDASARDAFMQILLDICSNNNTTLIFVSHDKTLEQYFQTKTNINSLITIGESA
ncbi:ABC transporter ATP-binding protein [Paraferrimonas sp. SM1919]|uniref:ABC transporter ATP-binding protein n=1 Tax=Paraferrimonas sp. SM1919 TaxID=2662263 RepID=UPI001F09F3BE|nr:ABC transporter ATP-binding protein [Paraferrimonas sp. SM1919]